MGGDGKEWDVIMIDRAISDKRIILIIMRQGDRERLKLYNLSTWETLIHKYNNISVTTSIIPLPSSNCAHGYV